MAPDDTDPESGCRLPLPKRDELDADGQRIYDSLADPNGGSDRGLRGPGGIQMHSPGVSRDRPALNPIPRPEGSICGRGAVFVTPPPARALDGRVGWGAHELGGFL